MVWYMQSLWCEVEWVGGSRNTDEKYYEDSVEYGFQLPSAKLGKGGEGGSEGIEVGYCIIIIYMKNWH